MDKYEITLQTLKELKKILPENPEIMRSASSDADKEESKALETVIHMVEYAKLHAGVEQSVTDIIHKSEMDELIPLATWAHMHGLDESYARQKARRGCLVTARKIGRDWFISAEEQNFDNRKNSRNRNCYIME